MKNTKYKTPQFYEKMFLLYEKVTELQLPSPKI
jgi:hypothetical protein